MHVKFDTLWLANDERPAFGFRVNGSRIIQEAQFLRAATAKFFARGNRSVSIGFQVSRQFSTVADCENFILGHQQELVGHGTLLCRVGISGETQNDVTLADAVLESVDIPEYNGVQSLVGYNFRASAVTGIAVVQPLQAPLNMRTFTIGNGTDKEFSLAHNLGTEDVLVQVRSTVTGLKVYEDLAGKKIVDANTVQINFGQPPAMNEYRVIIVG